jgi:hypothetical protein
VVLGGWPLKISNSSQRLLVKGDVGLGRLLGVILE